MEVRYRPPCIFAEIYARFMAFIQTSVSLLLWLLRAIIEKALNRAVFLPFAATVNLLASLHISISFDSVLDVIYMRFSTEQPEEFVFNVLTSQRDLVNKICRRAACRALNMSSS